MPYREGRRSRPSGAEELADRAVGKFGRVDALVVNHGIWTVSKNSWELDEEAWQESIDVLLSGAWKVSAAFVGSSQSRV